MAAKMLAVCIFCFAGIVIAKLACYGVSNLGFMMGQKASFPMDYNMLSHHQHQPAGAFERNDSKIIQGHSHIILLIDHPDAGKRWRRHVKRQFGGADRTSGDIRAGCHTDGTEGGEERRDVIYQEIVIRHV